MNGPILEMGLEMGVRGSRGLDSVSALRTPSAAGPSVALSAMHECAHRSGRVVQMKLWPLLLLTSCAAQVAPAQPAERQAICRPSGEMTCATETLNDGGGVDDHRQVCDGESGRWIFYPSGEMWRLDGEVVRCHVAADGTVLWPLERDQ